MVRLVEYPASSDEDRDVRSDNSSQWSSLSGIPSSPSDSLSCPMPSPESDEDDEDYAPSESSLGDASSVTSSVDTDDLDPEREHRPESMEDDGKPDTFNGTEQDKVIDLTQPDESRVFYAWKDIRAAFEDNPFKRRSVETEMEASGLNKAVPTEQKTANLFDMEAGTWSFHAEFAPGVADKKPRVCRRTSTLPSRFTGVSPRFSTLFTGEQQTPFQRDNSTDFLMDSPTKMSIQGNSVAAMQTADTIPSVKTRNEESNAIKIPKVSLNKATFGNKATVGGTNHFQSSSGQQVTSASTVSINEDGPARKPYKFVEHGSNDIFLSEAPSDVKIAADQDDTNMDSPSSRVQSTTRMPSHREFLFGQTYKNRLSSDSIRQNSNEMTQTARLASNLANAPSDWVHGSKAFTKGTLNGSFDANREHIAASTVFTTGIAGPKLQERNAYRRKKKSSTSTPYIQMSKSSASVLSSNGSAPTFGHSVFQAATATRERPLTTASPPATVPGWTRAKLPAQSSEMASATPSPQPFTGSFLFGDRKTDPFQAPDPSSFQTSTSGFAGTSTASATSTSDSSEQYLFGTGTLHHPFQFGEAATSLPAEATAFPFTGSQSACVSTSTFNDFQIGSSDTKQTSRVRSRKTGMFSNKNNPRKDVKTGSSEPEPSPGLSFSSLETPFPFDAPTRRSRTQYGRNIPADPLMTPTFQSFTSTEEEQPHMNAAKPVSWGNLPSVTRPSTASASSVDFGSVSRTQQSVIGQKLNAPLDTALHVSYQSAKRREDATRPAFAGSRRILRAALRNVGSRADRTQSASPNLLSTKYGGGDADMDSEDERDWEEYKRLGNIAHCARKFQDAAEYYRQSIEVLDSLLYHEAVEDSLEIRTDKAKLHANRAASLLMLMQITEAQHECRRSIEVDATYASAYLRLGRIQVLLGDTALAQANLNTAKQLMEDKGGEIRPGDEADHASLIKMEAKIKKLVLLQGEIKWYVDSGDYSQALVHTESALSLAPRSRKLQVQKAQILLHQRKFDEIVNFCCSIIQKQQATQRKMSCVANRGDMDANSLDDKTLEKITLLGIDLGLLWATTLHYQDKVDQAVRILNALEAVAPCSSHVIQLKRQWQDMKQLKHSGNEYFKRGEYQEAVRCYSEAVLIDPQHQEFCSIIYCNRAAAQMGLKRNHTAILDCNEALQRKPRYPRALLRRARCHVALEMYHEAVKDFDRYLHEQASDVPSDATADVRRERNEAKAAIAKAREEARRREAAKKRAEREQRGQRQRCSNRWENSSGRTSFHDTFQSGSSTNENGRHQSSGAGARSSFMAPKTQRRTHYDVLGIEKKATDDQIKKAYRKLALVYHPDKAKTSTHADLFKEMTAAYNVLSDGSARSKYDRELMYNRFGTFFED